MKTDLIIQCCEKAIRNATNIKRMAEDLDQFLTDNFHNVYLRLNGKKAGILGWTLLILSIIGSIVFTLTANGSTKFLLFFLHFHGKRTILLE